MSEDMNRNLNISVTLNTEKADQQYEKTKKEMSKNPIQVPVDLNLNELKAALGKIESELKNIGKVFGKEVNFSKLQKQIEDIGQSFEKTIKKTTNPKTNVQTNYLRVLGVSQIYDSLKEINELFATINKNSIKNESIEELSKTLKDISDTLILIQSNTALDQIRPSAVVQKDIDKTISKLKELEKEEKKIQSLNTYFFGKNNKTAKSIVQSLYDGEEDIKGLDNFIKRLEEFIKLGGDLNNTSIKYTSFEGVSELKTLQEIYDTLLSISKISPVKDIDISDAYTQINKLKKAYSLENAIPSGSLAKEMEQALEKEKVKIGVTIDTESLAQMSNQIATSLQKVNLVFDKMPDTINFGLPEGIFDKIIAQIEIATEAINNLRIVFEGSEPVKTNKKVDVTGDVDAVQFTSEITNKIKEESVLVNVSPTLDPKEFVSDINRMISSEEINVNITPKLSGKVEKEQSNNTVVTIDDTVTPDEANRINDVKNNIERIYTLLSEINQNNININFQPELESIAELLKNEVLNVSNVNKWAENFRQQLDSIYSKFQRLFGQNPLIEINKGYSQADYAQLLYGASGPEKLRERGFYFNSKTGEMTSPYKFDKTGSISQILKNESDDFSKFKYDTSWHSHPALNSVMSTLIKEKNGKGYSGDLFSWYNSFKKGIKTEINSSLLDTTVFDSLNFYKDYGSKIEEFLKASSQEQERIYNIKQKYFQTNNGLGEGSWNSWLDSFVQKYGENETDNKSIIQNLEKILPKTNNANINNAYQKAIDIIKSYYSDKGPQAFFNDIYKAAQNTTSINQLDQNSILPAIEKIENAMNLTSEEKNALARIKNLVRGSSNSEYFEKIFGFKDGLLSKGRSIQSYGFQQLLPQMMKEAFGIENFSDYFKVYSQKEFESLNLFGNDSQISKIFNTNSLERFNQILEEISKNVENLSRAINNIDFSNLASGINSLTSVNNITEQHTEDLNKEESAVKEVTAAEEQLHNVQKEQAVVSASLQEEDSYVKRTNQLSDLDKMQESVHSVVEEINTKNEKFKEEENLVTTLVPNEISLIDKLAISLLDVQSALEGIVKLIPQIDFSGIDVSKLITSQIKQEVQAAAKIAEGATTISDNPKEALKHQTRKVETVDKSLTEEQLKARTESIKNATEKLEKDLKEASTTIVSITDFYDSQDNLVKSVLKAEKNIEGVIQKTSYTTNYDLKSGESFTSKIDSNQYDMISKAVKAYEEILSINNRISILENDKSKDHQEEIQALKIEQDLMNEQFEVLRKRAELFDEITTATILSNKTAELEVKYQNQLNRSLGKQNDTDNNRLNADWDAAILENEKRTKDYIDSTRKKIDDFYKDWDAAIEENTRRNEQALKEQNAYIESYYGKGYQEALEKERAIGKKQAKDIVSKDWADAIKENKQFDEARTKQAKERNQVLLEEYKIRKKINELALAEQIKQANEYDAYYGKGYLKALEKEREKGQKQAKEIFAKDWDNALKENKEFDKTRAKQTQEENQAIKEAKKIIDDYSKSINRIEQLKLKDVNGEYTDRIRDEIFVMVELKKKTEEALAALLKFTQQGKLTSEEYVQYDRILNMANWGQYSAETRDAQRKARNNAEKETIAIREKLAQIAEEENQAQIKADEKKQQEALELKETLLSQLDLLKESKQAWKDAEAMADYKGTEETRVKADQAKISFENLRDAVSDTYIELYKIKDLIGDQDFAVLTQQYLSSKRNISSLGVSNLTQAKINDSATTSIGKWIEKLNSIKNSSKYVDDFKNNVISLQERIKNFDATKLVDPNLGEQASEEFKQIEDSYKQLISETNNPENLIANVDTISKLRTKVAKTLMENTAMPEDLKNRFKELQAQLQALENAGQANKKATSEQVTEYNRLIAVMNESGKVGLSFWDQLKKRLSSINKSFITMYFSFYDWIRYIRNIITTVKSLDTALVDLSKTFKGTNQELEEFYYASNDVAKQLGVTTEEIINQASAWSRLGYNTKDTAIEMAKLSSQFASISPGMTTETAQEGLVSIMKAWGIEVSDVKQVMDSINTLGKIIA